MSLPNGLLIAWVGDDFTGSAATMEALAFAGIPAVLFAGIPTDAQRARFPDARAIGIATTARSHGPDWMDQHLPPIYDYLSSTGAGVIHYKTCSTLDSAPHVGSIGKALDVGAQHVPNAPIPFLLAAPQMRRYQAFGQLFASAGDTVHRLDRHPVMSRHPVTPMTEADVAKHLSAQTSQKLTNLSLEALATATPQSFAARTGIVTLDAMTPADMAANGALIWSLPQPALVGGSQGIEYALIAHWQDAELIDPINVTASAGPVDQLIAVSGSVSPTTADQIAWAEANGFEIITLDVIKAAKGDGKLAYDESIKALKNGKDALICTAKGPDDPSVAALQAALPQLENAQAQIGATLGRVLKDLLLKTGLKRAVISGGDTSGHACRELDVFAFTARAPTIPGAALLDAHSDNPAFAGLQLALKGGQMGSADYFGWIKRGGGTAQKGEPK